MSAHRGYGLIYARVIRGLDEDAVDEIDAILGDRDAAGRVNAARNEAFAAMGAEVG